MRQQLVQYGERFSAEHMEAIRRHFNESQLYAGEDSDSADGSNTGCIKLLSHAWGSVTEWPIRGLAKDTEQSLPDWRVVAAALVLSAGLIIFGIYLLPHQ